MNKILYKILNDRIVQHLKDKGLWHINQNGFKEKNYLSRTDDNIMILHTLFQKYVESSKGNLYIAMVYFSNFFDCLNRKILLYNYINSLKVGSPEIYTLSAYENSQYKIKLNGALTESFTSSTGVQQGCTLKSHLVKLISCNIS